MINEDKKCRFWIFLICFIIGMVSYPTASNAESFLDKCELYAQELPRLAKMTTKQIIIMVEYDVPDPDLMVATAEILKLHEGFRSKVYRCSSGQASIGYGTAVPANTRPVTRYEAEQLLLRELKVCVEQLNTHLPWWTDLTKSRKMALLDLTYNMGVDSLLKFKRMLRSMETGNYTTASKQLLQSSKGGKSKYYRQVGKRAEWVSSAIATNTWDIEKIQDYHTS